MRLDSLCVCVCVCVYVCVCVCVCVCVNHRRSIYIIFNQMLTDPDSMLGDKRPGLKIISRYF